MPIASEIRGCSRSSLTLTAETADGVIYARARGVVTLAGVATIRERLSATMAKASAICVDYSSAALALTDHDLAALAQAARPGVNGSAMAWLVADQATASLWRSQALKFALVGLRRFATCDPSEARWWVELQSRRAAVPL